MALTLGGDAGGVKGSVPSCADRLGLPLRSVNRLLEGSAPALLGGSGMRSGHPQGLCPKMAVAGVGEPRQK